LEGRISWLKGALREFHEFPAEVQREAAQALSVAARGRKVDIAKPFRASAAACSKSPCAIAAMRFASSTPSSWATHFDHSCVPEEIEDRNQDPEAGGGFDPRSSQAAEGGPEMKNDDTELVHGSGNVFRDLGHANPEAES
jgi:hypothetical protein